MEKKCDNCQDVIGFNLGTTCPKCNKPFRSIIQISKQEQVLLQSSIDGDVIWGEKKETLEEASERLTKHHKYDECTKINLKHYISLGAKWQEQQTIEEIFEWLTTNNYLTDLKETMIKDFNKFKNK